ncbi:hypothetical protein ACFQV2_05350 [Actinokineospora soli]|uniref:DUF3558 domain-containing protein n=1 Tax=Actinokineospora soli TaxID=1048753 RepID=A0ABW2THB6_9PSEU
MRLRTASALVTAALTAPLVPACAAGPRPRRRRARPPRLPARRRAQRRGPRAAVVSVTTPKKVGAVLDCGRFLPAVVQGTGIDATVKADESTAELCRYALPYNRGLTTASIFFRAEPPGTPSYRPVGELFGNTAYQVDGAAGKDCGISVALDARKQAHQHGSHLTVLGTYEGREEPCAITRRITEIVFGQLADA